MTRQKCQIRPSTPSGLHEVTSGSGSMWANRAHRRRSRPLSNRCRGAAQNTGLGCWHGCCGGMSAKISPHCSGGGLRA